MKNLLLLCSRINGLLEGNVWDIVTKNLAPTAGNTAASRSAALSPRWGGAEGRAGEDVADGDPSLWGVLSELPFALDVLTKLMKMLESESVRDMIGEYLMGY